METLAIQSKEEITKEIAELYEKMKRDAVNWDDEEASSIWTDDGKNMPFYGIAQNKQEMLRFVKDISLNNQWEIVDYTPLELFVHDDMAYEFSLFEHNTTPKEGGKTVNTKMRCITVYKRINGTWKIHRWMPQYKAM